MARTSSRRHKGCQTCKMWKHAGNGDQERQPFAVWKKIGKARRSSRRSLGDQEY